MPLYEFRCPHCGATFEELCKADAQPICPKCGASGAVRLLSAFATKSSSGFAVSTKSGGCGGCSGGSCSSCH